MEKTFLNPATSKQWRIEIDGLAIRTCLNGGKVKEILCDSAFQVKSKAASAMMSQMTGRGCFYWRKPLWVWQKLFAEMDSTSIWMTCIASTPREKAS